MTIKIDEAEVIKIIKEYDGDINAYLEDKIEAFKADYEETDKEGVEAVKKRIVEVAKDIDNCKICKKPVGYENLKSLKNARHYTGKMACCECSAKYEDNQGQLYFNFEAAS